MPIHGKAFERWHGAVGCEPQSEVDVVKPELEDLGSSGVVFNGKDVDVGSATFGRTLCDVLARVVRIRAKVNYRLSLRSRCVTCCAPAFRHCNGGEQVLLHQAVVPIVR